MSADGSGNLTLLDLPRGAHSPILVPCEVLCRVLVKSLLERCRSSKQAGWLVESCDPSLLIFPWIIFSDLTLSSTSIAISDVSASGAALPLGWGLDDSSFWDDIPAIMEGVGPCGSNKEHTGHVQSSDPVAPRRVGSRHSEWYERGQRKQLLSLLGCLQTKHCLLFGSAANIASPLAWYH